MNLNLNTENGMFVIKVVLKNDPSTRNLKYPENNNYKRIDKI